MAEQHKPIRRTPGRVNPNNKDVPPITQMDDEYPLNAKNTVSQDQYTERFIKSKSLLKGTDEYPKDDTKKEEVKEEPEVLVNDKTPNTIEESDQDAEFMMRYEAYLKWKKEKDKYFNNQAKKDVEPINTIEESDQDYEAYLKWKKEKDEYFNNQPKKDAEQLNPVTNISTAKNVITEIIEDDVTIKDNVSEIEPEESPVKKEIPEAKVDIVKEEIKEETIETNEESTVNDEPEITFVNDDIDSYENTVDTLDGTDNEVDMGDFTDENEEFQDTVKEPTKQQEYVVDLFDKTLYPEGYKILSPLELDEYAKNSDKHFKILEGRVSSANTKSIDVTNTKSITIRTETDSDKSYSAQLLLTRRKIDEGNRMVEVVAVQSGYKCLVSALKQRELRTIGRVRDNQDTYAYRLSIYETLFKKLSRFSCGNLSFEQFLRTTTYPDSQTLFFGLYSATFPGENEYRIRCENNKCPTGSFNIPINNDTLICVPPGTSTIQNIMQIIKGDTDPKEVMKNAYSRYIRRVFLDDNKKFVDFKIPSIYEFLQKAYMQKKEEIIEEYSTDMYYAGFVNSIGYLNVDEFSKTGRIEYFQIKDSREVDRFIADLSAEEKVEFDREAEAFLQECTVSYRIPKLRCPHCKHIMIQKELNMENLFFYVKSRKGL